MSGDPTITDWLGIYSRELSAVLGSLAMATAYSTRSPILGAYSAEGCARSLRRIAAEMDEMAAKERARADTQGEG